jgi:hypothetical protein
VGRGPVMLFQIVSQFTEPAIGREWVVENVVVDQRGKRRGDGDTCLLIRSRIDFLGDHRYRVEDVDPVSIRLVWVNTPERGQVGYRDAADDLSQWLDEAFRMGSLMVVIYYSAGWDRLLGNIIRADGQSASQYLITECGWDIYKKED